MATILGQTGLDPTRQVELLRDVVRGPFRPLILRAAWLQRNESTVRRLAVSLLRQDQTTKNGAKAKRMKAALDPNYLLHVLKHAHLDA